MRNLSRAPAHPRSEPEIGELVRSNLEPLVDRIDAVRGDDRLRRKTFTPLRPGASPCTASSMVLGGAFRFESDSRELMALVDAAYGRLPPQTLPGVDTEFHVELRLVPRRANADATEPSAPCIRREGDRFRARFDASNYAAIDTESRSARVVVSEDMLRHAYHVRCELIEFAVFVLATHAIGLAPLHGACVGRGDRGVLLLGDSGAGKSTLALHGALHGLELLAEDAVFVRPADLLATGVPNYLHLKRDALELIGNDAIRAWIARAPIIRRRSGVEKFEVDLRHEHGRPATSAMALAGVVFVSARSAGSSGARLDPLDIREAERLLETSQPNAARQRGWRQFKREILRRGLYQLQRGNHPRDSVDAIARLLV